MPNQQRSYIGGTLPSSSPFLFLSSDNVPHNQRGNHPRTSSCPAAGSCGCCMSKFPSLLAQALALLLPLCLLPLLFHYGLLFGLRFCPIGSRSLSFDRRRLFVVQWVGRSFKPSPIQSYNVPHNQRGNYPRTSNCPATGSCGCCGQL